MVNKLVGHNLKIWAILILSFVWFASWQRFVFADTIPTSVVVGNLTPGFSVPPAEEAISYDGSPTDAGSVVGFEATVIDSGNESYYFIVCKTNAVTPTPSGAPTCGGGTWCTGPLTGSGVSSYCQYTTQLTDPEQNTWFGFACDGNPITPTCSPASQGNGDSGSPFDVNHRPQVDTITIDNDAPSYGDSVTWKAGAGTLDSDVIPTADSVRLIMCKTAAVAGGDCEGGTNNRWCQSGFVTAGPECSITIDDAANVGHFAAYPYVLDVHGMLADSPVLGQDLGFTVTDTPPLIEQVSVNSNKDIVLTEGATTPLSVHATVHDVNGCQDIKTVKAYLYRSGVGFAGCDQASKTNSNSCYAEFSCQRVSGADTCEGTENQGVTYQCQTSLQYFTDPTDAETPYADQTWTATVVASDTAGMTGNASAANGVEVGSLLGFDMDSVIRYVSTSTTPGDKLVLLNSITIRATGNVGLDHELIGSRLSYGSAELEPSALRVAPHTWGGFPNAVVLALFPREVETNLRKPTTKQLTSEVLWFGLQVDRLQTVQPSGEVIITGIKSEFKEW